MQVEPMILQQWLSYRQALRNKSISPNTTAATPYIQSMKLLLGRLRLPSAADADGNESDKASLNEDSSWPWNPFESNIGLVELLEELTHHPEEDDQLVGVIGLLCDTFVVGPPRSRNSVTPSASKILVNLYLERADTDCERTRTIGHTVATWLYNNNTAKALLHNTGFMASLDKITMQLELVPTIALILQNWAHSSQDAQETVAWSSTFKDMQRVLTGMRSLRRRGLQEEASRRFVHMALELHVANFDKGLASTTLWQSLCLIYARFSTVTDIAFKCAQVMLDIKSICPLLVLTERAESACMLHICLAKASDSRIPLLRELIKDAPYHFLPSTGNSYDPDLV